jgi:hypothetical protein
MSTSSEQQAEKNAQNKTISGLTEQLNTLTSAIKLMGKDMAGNGVGSVGKGVGRAANVVVDATLDEIPGGRAIAGMVGDAKKYFTGLKERAKAEAEKKSSKNESKDIIDTIEKTSQNESREFGSELEKSRHENSNDNKEIIKEVKKVTEVVKESNNIAIIEGLEESHELKHLTHELEKSSCNETKESSSDLEKSSHENSNDNKEIVDAIKETTKAIKESNDIARKAAAEEKIKEIKDKDTVAQSQLVKPDNTKKDEKSNGIFGALGATVMGSIMGIMKSATTFLTAGLAAIGTTIMKGLGVALRFAGRALFLAVRLLNPIGWALLIADLLVTFKDDIIGFFKGDGFKNFIQSTKQLLIDAWDGIVKFFKETDWSGLIKSAAEGISNFIDTIGTWFKDSMVSLWEGVKNWVSDLTEVISVIGTAIYDNLLTPLGTWVLDSVKSMWDAVTDKISGWITDFKTLVSDKWDGAKQFLNDIPNKLMEPFDTLIKWFDNARLGGKLNDLLSGVTDKILEGFASIYNMTVAKLPGVDTKMLPNGKLVKSDDYAEYENLVNAGNSTQDAAAKITQMISDRESAEHQYNVKKVMAEQHVTAEQAEVIVTQQEKEKNQGVIGKAVTAVGNGLSKVGDVASGAASYVSDKASSAVDSVKAFFSKSSSDGKYQIISNGGRTSAVGAKGKFDASSDAMNSLLATNTGLNNSLPTGAAGDSVKNNLVRVDEQIWEPLKRIDPGVKISSGFRSKEVNQRIGGALQSDHTEGRAIDIVPGPGQTPTDLANAIIDNNLPFSKLIVEPSWVHVSLPKEGETNVQRLVMVSDDAMAENAKYGPVKIESIHLNNDLPPISGSPTRAQATGKIPQSAPISSPTPSTGDMVATGTASVSKANTELNAAIFKSASDSSSGATVTANNGNTVNNVTVINTSTGKSSTW